MRVGNNNDVVHILNKKTGAFDEVTATNPEFHAHEVIIQFETWSDVDLRVM